MKNKISFYAFGYPHKIIVKRFLLFFYYLESNNKRITKFYSYNNISSLIHGLASDYIAQKQRGAFFQLKKIIK